MTELQALPERESAEFDVVIVGAGPAGLSTAIRLKQIAPSLSVVVLEKGAEIGAHILSGAVIDPIGVDRLLPGWREEADHPFRTAVVEERFLLLGARHAVPVPQLLLPPLMRNHGNFIVSLGDVCRWLGRKAEALGVEIYPGFAAAEALYDETGAVIGVATGDTGLAPDGTPGAGYARGMALLGKYVVVAEGARGSLAKQLIARFGLDAGRQPQKFGLGFKELWRVPREKHRRGLVQHSLGWPLDAGTGGGSFLYHLEDDLVAVGFVVHLDYRNPYLSPFEEFQRFKTHPAIRPDFEGGTRLAYGARAITEGGYQSVPKLAFPGGVLAGCAAGLVNVPRLKGVHNAMLSGILAAEVLAAALRSGRAHDEPTEMEERWRGAEVGADLRPVRNIKPLWSKFGLFAGLGLAGLDIWANTLGASPFGTLPHGRTDAAALDPAAAHRPIAYPKPDGKLSFDRLSSVFLSNVGHAEGQPVHLLVGDPKLQEKSELAVFAGPSTRYCPAGVYEWVERDGRPAFLVNAQNCIHCKTCDIKDPNGNITWQPPQGGEGPNYGSM